MTAKERESLTLLLADLVWRRNVYTGGRGAACSLIVYDLGMWIRNLRKMLRAKC